MSEYQYKYLVFDRITEMLETVNELGLEHWRMMSQPEFAPYEPGDANGPGDFYVWMERKLEP